MNTPRVKNVGEVDDNTRMIRCRAVTYNGVLAFSVRLASIDEVLPALIEICRCPSSIA
jgi:hypothetical protein